MPISTKLRQQRKVTYDRLAGADVELLGDELLLWFSADEKELGQCLEHDGHPPFTYDEKEDSRSEPP